MSDGTLAPIFLRARGARADRTVPAGLEERLRQILDGGRVAWPQIDQHAHAMEPALGAELDPGPRLREPRALLLSPLVDDPERRK